MDNSQTPDTDASRQTAVAIKSDHGPAPTPRVTAIGHGENAEKMLLLAFANEVKVRRDGDLTQVLGAMELDSPVPIEALEAVGEILSYVYEANRSWQDPLEPAADADTTNRQKWNSDGQNG